MATPRPLTPTQVAFFHEEGYLIVPDVFDPVVLEPLRQEIHGEINRKARELLTAGRLQCLHDELGFDRQLSAIYRESKVAGDAIVRHLMGVRGGGYYSPAMFGLIVNPFLVAKIGSLVASDEIVASAYRIRPKLPNFGAGVVPWHQDSGYLAEHCDEHLIITCWVPFVDATAENGCMQILPRTHRGRVYQHHAGGNADFLVIRDQDLPDDPRRAITAACPRGGAVFMSNRTPHCSTPTCPTTFAGVWTSATRPPTSRTMSASNPRPWMNGARRTRHSTRRSMWPAIRRMPTSSCRAGSTRKR